MHKLLFLLFSLLSFANYADEFRPGFLSLIEYEENHFQVMFKVPMKGNLRLRLTPILPQGCTADTQKYINENGRASTSRWILKCQDPIYGTTLSIEGINNTAIDVLLRIEFLNGSLVSDRFNPKKSSIAIPDKKATSVVVNIYVLLGIEHILMGWDHLLFVTCLLIICGLSISNIKRIMLTITGFTLAHSITLIATSMQWVHVPIVPIEALIALSILFLASEVLKQNKNSLTWRYPILVSSSFGLIHGFGFASVLSEIGLPEDNVVTALLSFNIGIEIGQLLFIVVLILLMQMVKFFKLERYPKVSAIPIYFIGIISAYWFIERLNNIF